MQDEKVPIVGQEKQQEKEPEYRILIIYKPLSEELGIHRLTPIDAATLIGILNMARDSVSGPQHQESLVKIPGR